MKWRRLGPRLRNLSHGNVAESMTGTNFGGTSDHHEAESYLDHLSGGREVFETEAGKFRRVDIPWRFDVAGELILRGSQTLANGLSEDRDRTRTGRTIWRATPDSHQSHAKRGHQRHLARKSDRARWGGDCLCQSQEMF